MFLVDVLFSASQLKQYMYYDMMPESRNSSLLGNVSVNTFPRKRRRATTEERCFLWGPPRGYITKIPGELEWELRESVESWALRREVRRDGNEIVASCNKEWELRETPELVVARIMARKELRLHGVLQLQWEGYESVARMRLVESVIDWGHLCVCNGEL
jgi:hypothetical protein